MKSDPWKRISAPVGSEFTARRVDPEHPFDFFWARDLEGNCLLVFEYSTSASLGGRRPKLREIQIIEPIDSGCRSRFIMKLTHDENREVFHRLCLDIVESSRRCKSEAAALGAVIRRTWRWHGMLRGGRDECLGPDAQKGLVGELRVLELVLLPSFSTYDALDCWRGPEGAPKDFSIGTVSIESKARRGTATPYIEISSEHQLDLEGLDHLFLAVTQVDQAAANSAGAQSLSEYVAHIAELALESDPASVGYLEARLEEAGFSSAHDYSDWSWVIGNTRWYQVSQEFPRLADCALPGGVSRVRYSLDLPACAEWETDSTEVIRVLMEAGR